jgi:hypothetical protein
MIRRRFNTQQFSIFDDGIAAATRSALGTKGGYVARVVHFVPQCEARKGGMGFAGQISLRHNFSLPQTDSAYEHDMRNAKCREAV